MNVFGQIWHQCLCIFIPCRVQMVPSGIKSTIPCFHLNRLPSTSSMCTNARTNDIARKEAITVLTGPVLPLNTRYRIVHAK